MKLSNLTNPRWIGRAWYYFRMGYSTYLTFLLGYVSTLVTVYYLAIRNAPPLLEIFPHFAPFAVLATVIGGPLAVLAGWVHFKRSILYSSEADIAAEANPYQYKLPPGYAKEALFPATLLQFQIMRRLGEKNGILSEAEIAQIAELEKKLQILIDGGIVGTVKRSKKF